MSKTPSSVDTYVETLKDELVEVQPTVDALTEKRLDYAQGPVTPFQWSKSRKWLQAGTLCFVGFLTAVLATCIGPSEPVATEYFNISSTQWLLSNTGFFLAFAFVPLLLVPVAERFGRRPIFLISTIIYALLHIPASLTRNYTAFAVTRMLLGASGSCANMMVAGSISDMWVASERGTALNVFAFSIFAGQSIGPIIGGWLPYTLSIGWLFGIQGIVAGIGAILYGIVGRETHISAYIPADTLPDKSFKAITQSLKIAVARPLTYLVSEPIVIALSLWMGFAWALIYLFGSSILLVFTSYDFSYSIASLFQVTIIIGSVLGFVTNLHQDHLYRQAASQGNATPERRLIYGCAGGIALPIFLFIFAWTGTPSVHWIVPAIALVGVNWATYCMYLGVFSYIADSYERYSSSAQAAQSAFRNALAAGFPLFARAMYQNLGYSIAGTVLACIAVGLAIVPFMLVRYGPVLRAKSKASRELLVTPAPKTIS